MNFNAIKNEINRLGNAEYRYDRLVSEFSEHYLTLKEAKYEVMPDLQILHTWLKHLNQIIRPALVEHWKIVAIHAGFSLGDLIEVDGVKIYAIKADAFPDLKYVRFTGFSAKKDGSAGQSAVTMHIEANTEIRRLNKSLEASVIEPLFFEGSTRLSHVREFLKQELQKIS